jgi:voltage-dependent calcium channel L type alpha-1D
VLALFFVECAFKVIAQGFVMHSNAYLRSPWNWVDFVVVVTGLLELLPVLDELNISWLRTFRVLRPLRSITAFPSMKKLIQSMINAIPSLFGVVVFMGFILMNFAILANSQFAGAYYSRCRLTPEAVGDEWPYDPSIERLCSMDPERGFQCPAG